MPLYGFPLAVSNMMQGLAFWIGHRHSMFSGHKLPEAALVVEASNLVNARLDGKFLMFNEIEYSKLTKVNCSKILTKHSRADMVIALKPKEKKSEEIFDFKKNSIFIIEFKRAGSRHINHDLQRLAEIKRFNKDIRPFLIVVAESTKPKDYVGDDYKAKPGEFPIANSKFRFRVRRVCKAAASFSEKQRKSIHYVCALEVIK
jgi:hypothetical protein